MMNAEAIMISIIMVAKNCVEGVESTLQSVLCQEYSHYEIIVIDGNSQDGTVEVFEKYKDKLAYFSSEEDAGIYEAMNKGIRQASGELILMLNVKDTLYHEKVLSEYVNAYEVTKADVLIGHAEMTKNGKSIHKRFLAEIDDAMFIAGMPFSHQTMVYKKSLHEEFGFYNEKLAIASDYEFVLKLYYHKKTFYSLKKILITFDRTGFAANNQALSKEEMQIVRHSYFTFMDTDDFKLFFDDINKNLPKLIKLSHKYVGFPLYQTSIRDFIIRNKLKRRSLDLVQQRVTSEVAVILGNGASLKGFDFKKNLEGMTTFGMNAAYRYWDTINWYPDYYCCLDLVVGLSHKEEIKRLIENSSKYGIKQFLLRDNLIQALGDFQCKEKVLNFDEINQNSLFLAEPRITTGSHTCAWAAEMGFKNILLLGIDSNYVEMIPEASLNDAQELVIERTPKYNPNYFFDNYQQAGDKYNIPNHSSEPTKMVHRASWNNLSTSFTQYDVVVLNGSKNSKLNCFYKIDFANIQEMFSSLRKQHIIVDNLYLPTKKISENDIVIHYFDGNKGIMLEVGAHHGSETIKQLAAGWQVYAFEPDDNNREIFIMKTAAYFNQITLDNRAVSNKSNELCSFYTSDVSTGISSLASFHESHRKTKEVKTITLRDYIAEESIKYIDFLKIDAEGFDLMVLKGFPFETIQPKCILCEFEDNKTLSLGYNMADMKLFLENHGYTVYVSEWCPIKEYGVSHTWKRIFKGEPITFSPNAWGNLLAFKEDPGEEKIKELLLKPAPTFSYTQPCFAKDYKNMFKYRVLSFFSFGEQKKKNRLRYNYWKIRLATFSPKQIKVYILGILVLSILVHSNIKIFQLFSILPFMITKKTFSNHKIRILGLQVYKQKTQG